MKKAILIYSGGLDSTVLLYKLVKENYRVIALSFDYGQRHVKELLCAKWNCNYLNVPHIIFNLRDFSDLTKDASPLLRDSTSKKDLSVASQTVIPNRNMVMLSIAASLAISQNINEIYFAATGADQADYPDCRPTFIKAATVALQLATAHPSLQIKAPFISLKKSQVVEEGVKLGVPFERTWTCYRGEERPCLQCASCKERIKAFEEAGVEDPLLK